MVKKRLNNIYKIMNVILCSVLMLLFASCKASYVPSEEAEAIMSSKWYDIFDGDEIVNDGVREIELEEFPGVTFRAYFGGIEATSDNGIVHLYEGMPVNSVYFCDLNDDDKPELCSCISIGSGMIDERIIVCDYVNDVRYEISDRGEFDYRLSLREGKLTVEKYEHMYNELLDLGYLIINDETLQIIWNSSEK